MDKKIIDINNSVILRSMKDVLESEIVELEKELNKLYKKYDVKSSKEMELITCKDEEMKMDFYRMMKIEEDLENLRKCLRDLNLKTI